MLLTAAAGKLNTDGISAQGSYAALHSAVIEAKLLYRVAFWWTALENLHNVGLLDGVRRSASIHITGALLTIPTKALIAMFNWLPTELPVSLARYSLWSLFYFGNWSCDPT